MAKGGKPKVLGARKATQYRAKAIEPEKQFDKSKSRARRLETYEDTYGSGDEDQFHLNRDKLLLEDDGASGRAGADGLDEPDTIYDLDLPSSQSGSDDGEDEEEDEEEAPERVPRHLREYKRKDAEDLKTQGRFGHQYDPKQDVVFPSSEEESDDDERGGAVDQGQLASTTLSDGEEDDATGRGKGGAESDSDLEQDHERWAAGHYHVSRRAPGEADSEDEEALELEEQEARRLQRKMRDRLAGEDYGVAEGDEADDFDGADGLASGKGHERLRLEEDEDEPAAAKKSTTGTSATAPTPDSLTEEESIALLLRTQPETLALVDDFLLTASKLSQVSRDLTEVRAARDERGQEHPALAMMELEYQALTTYLPTLAFYFSLLLAPTPPAQDLVDKVLARLSSLRGALATMEELDLTSATYGGAEDEEDDDDEEEDEGGVDLAPSKRRRVVPPEEMFDLTNSDASTDPSDEDDDDDAEEISESMLVGLDDDELEELMAQLGPGDGADVLMEKVRARQREKGIEVPGSGSEEEDEDVEMESDDEADEEPVASAPPPQKKRKEFSIPELPALAPPSKTQRSAPRNAAASAASDYLDPLALSSTDRADKASKRHTLRFHAAQVEQKASKRDSRRRGLEGDDDLPRRSKEQARREVLKKQQHGAAKDAEKRAKLDDGEFGDEDARDARAVRGDDAGSGGDEGGDDDDGYYDLVAVEKAEGRQAKKARYDEARAAEREEILALAESSVDGPRAATRKILSNRGLTPKRNKLNRNARVKKRHQFDQKQKKLRSMQATYSGGEARTGYEGEKTGISRQNVRSRKLD
ncbi:hypothetical protein JCM8202_004264 [Rhodotorula sphaerocarpa]